MSRPVDATIEYTPGDWLALLRAERVLVIPGDTDPGKVHALWDLLGTGPGPEQVLQELLRAHGMELERLCPFALATLEPSPRVLLRGALGLRATAPSGDTIEHGSDVGTWTERRITAAQTLTLGPLPLANTSGNWWPLREGIVLVGAIRAGLTQLELTPLDLPNADRFPAAPSNVESSSIAASLPDVSVAPAALPDADVVPDVSVVADAVPEVSVVPVPALEPDTETTDAAGPRASAGPETASYPVIVVHPESAKSPKAADAPAEPLRAASEEPAPPVQTEPAPTDPAETPRPGDTAADEDTLISAPAHHRGTAPVAPAAGADPDDQDTILGSSLSRPVREPGIAVREALVSSPVVQRAVVRPPSGQLPAPLIVSAPGHPQAPATHALPQAVAPAPIPGLISSTPWTGPKPAVQHIPPSVSEISVPAPAPAPVPHAVSVPVEHPAAAGDHDGQTLLRSNLPASADPAPDARAQASARDIGTGPLVISLICAAGHANPPTAAHCSRCGLALGTQTVQAPRPALGHMLLADGQRIELDRSVVVGRQPSSPRASSASMPRMLQVKSPSGDISRSHLEIRLDGWHVLLTDLNATNGTRLLRPGAAPRRLGTGESVLLLAGDAADLGDGVSLHFEDLP